MFADVLSKEHPLIFLLNVSQWFAPPDTSDCDDPDGFALETLEVLAGSKLAGLRAADYAITEMVADSHEDGGPELPSWLRYLDKVEIAGCWCGYHEDDLDHVVGVGVRFADGQEGTLVTITDGVNGHFIDAFLSRISYARTALNWIDRNPSMTGLSKINNASAATTLRQALENSDPVDPDGIEGQADWVLGSVVISWVIGLLTKQL